jgi:DNA-binding transcriptional LysR family regulator
MLKARFTLRQLEAFVTVAQALSFTDAANQMALTSSAVSQLVGELEESCGFKLFDRNTRRVRLSSSGREFLAFANSVLTHTAIAQGAANDVRNRAAGIVRIAAPMVVASVLLPKAIKAYAQHRPKVKVQIRDVPVDKLVDAVMVGDVDLALGPDRAVDEDILRQPLFESAWVLWCSPQHPLARKRVVSWEHLRSIALVAAGRDHERSVPQMAQNLPGDERVTPIEIVENVSTALGLAAVNLAATLTPAYVEAMATPLGLVKKRITQPEVMRYLCLYQSTRRMSSPAAQGFAEFLNDYFGK